jgi:hypothetical protein
VLVAELDRLLTANVLLFNSPAHCNPLCTFTDKLEQLITLVNLNICPIMARSFFQNPITGNPISTQPPLGSSFLGVTLTTISLVLLTNPGENVTLHALNVPGVSHTTPRLLTPGFVC